MPQLKCLASGCGDITVKGAIAGVTLRESMHCDGQGSKVVGQSTLRWAASSLVDKGYIIFSSTVLVQELEIID